MLIFNGTTRQANTNDLSGLNGALGHFQQWRIRPLRQRVHQQRRDHEPGGHQHASGVTWTGVPLRAKTWTVASGSELVLNNTTTVEVNGDHNIYGGGTLRQKGAMNIGQATTANPAFVVNEGRASLWMAAASSRGAAIALARWPRPLPAPRRILTNGAILTLTVSGGNFRVGDSANPVTSRLVIDHSTVSIGRRASLYSLCGGRHRRGRPGRGHRLRLPAQL